MQVVQIPAKDWKRIERILNRLDGEKKAVARAEWITAPEFAKRSNKTREQLRGFRQKHPDMIKVLPTVPRSANETAKEVATRYLYNWTAYAAVYLTQ